MRRAVGPALALLVAVRALGAQDRGLERPDVRDDQEPQGRPCEVVMVGVERGGVVTTRMNIVTASSGAKHTYVGGGVDVTCAGQANRLLADSAEHFQDRGLLILYRDVRYTEPRITIESDRMFYYTAEERLVADGNVRGTTASGTRFAGPQFDYYRARPGIRPLARWVAVGRPFVRMSPSETGAPADATDSTDLTANRVVSSNDSLVWASGNVVIERSDIRSTSDSAAMDNGREFAQLIRGPRIVGRGERPFTLVGREIHLWSRQRQLERVLALDSARVDSDSLTLTSDTLDLRFRDQQIARVMAWGGRAHADAPQQQVEADSMDILMPGQRLDELRAIGRARVQSRADSARVVTTERDWIAGDTVVARFATVPDSASGRERTQMREVVASGDARAFYQLPPAGSERGEPNLSYNRGRLITVSFSDGEMATVVVTDGASGLYLERTPPAGRAAAPAARPRP